jgi:hypothetical protein
MKLISRLALPALILSFGLSALPPVHASELPMATGEHWTTATEREKRAFLLGMGTILEIEHEFQADNPPAPGTSAVPPLVNGLSDYTLEGLTRNLDQWYADNPDGLERPVIEVIWTEFALPNLAQ